MEIRSPIIAVMGHVDHGKTTLLDSIRGSKVAEKEAGRITQMVGASYVPKFVIENLSKGLAKRLGISLVIPGLLFIDTPGHEAFSNLRERGGSIADMAILVVDAMQGFQPQTIESLRILREYKTPFVIAMNKIDLIDGWRVNKTQSILESLSLQSDEVKWRLDEKLYALVGKIAEYGFDAERFDRIDDFSKKVAIIPVSAKTKEGSAELLLIISGLSQKYLKERLYIHPDEPAKGSIMEVKEEKGMGTVVDVIVYDGVLKKGDNLFVPTKKGIIRTKVRGLFQPNVSTNNPKERFRPVDKVVAAAGVRIVAPNLEGAIPGAPFGVEGGIDEKEVMKSIKSIMISDEKGVLIKADSLGSCEALLRLCKKENIPVGKVDIGPVSKEDAMFVKAMQESFPYSAVLAFNVAVKKEALGEGVPILTGNVIYKIVEQYNEWVEAKKKEDLKKLLLSLTYPVKLKALPGFFFRMSKPAIFGIEVLEGKLKPGVMLMNKEGKVLGEVKSIQEKKESLPEAEKGMKVAISVSGVTLGKDIKEGDTLYSYMTKKEIEAWDEQMDLLDESAAKALEEIKRVLRPVFMKKK